MKTLDTLKDAETYLKHSRPSNEDAIVQELRAKVARDSDWSDYKAPAPTGVPYTSTVRYIPAEYGSDLT